MVVGFRNDSDSDSAGNSIGKAAGHQDAALDVVDPRLEMHVAGLRVRPGVEDRDDRTALPFLRRVAHLHGARAMAKGAKIVGRKPARATERFGTFLVCHAGTCSRPSGHLTGRLPGASSAFSRFGPISVTNDGAQLHHCCLFPNLLPQGRCQPLTRRKFRNLSRNRPDTTNLNHQYAIRRVFMCAVLDRLKAPTGIMDNAEIF